MKTTIIYALFATCFLLGCADPKPESTPEKKVVAKRKSEDKSTVQKEQKDKNVILTIQGGPDGPEQWFYCYTDSIETYKDVEGVTELHIVPFEEGGPIESMISIEENDFELNSPYDKLTAKVKIFYDQDKSSPMMEYQLVDGKADGACVMKKPTGEVFISRVYKNGEWEKSEASPFGVDWIFDQQSSNLVVRDTANAIRKEGDDVVLELMHSMHQEDSKENSMYALMQKESFKNEFKVNGKAFTGQLITYFNPKGLEDRMYYKLPFVDGKLNGEVIINNDWGRLELHEKFTMGELDTVLFQLDYSKMEGLAKPIIYLYPEEECEVEVKLKIDGKLTHTYPKYEYGWKVKAQPDGTLFDESGKEYYALYWEGLSNNQFTIKEGAIIRGEQSAEFLEKALETLGLTRREANEFIVYWLPQLEQNPYNLIHFSTKEYEEMAQLEITPEPETIIRVMMVFEPLTIPKAIKKQNLEELKVDRKGFTVVEWGGSKIERDEIL